MNDYNALTIPRPRRRLPLLFALPFLAGCGGLQVEEYEAATPLFDPFVFFEGRVQAWGVVQDWRGRVTRRFDVTIDGSTSDGILTLDESFTYSDGETDKRVWKIRREEAGNLSGSAGDIVGTAAGETSGNAMRWKYDMDLDVSGRQYRVRFDDWMWQLDERTLVNRSYIRKFGVTVAEVTLFMQKAGT